MFSNFHTHSTFCDGKNTLEEMVESAIEKEFRAIGFSGHGHTFFDTSYCLKDTDGYIKEIARLKEKYCGEIEIYTGVEEDAFSPVDRSVFDYIIGSSHYFKINDKYYTIDSSPEELKECVDLLGGDVTKAAEVYYSTFCEYILKRKPDIIGHFDLITKYDEISTPLFLNNEKCIEIAKKYIQEAAKSGSVFEVNTGAISRGYRTSPYPCEELLYTLKKIGAKVMLSSDCHNAKFLDCNFKETANRLREIGFEYLYTIKNGEFVKEKI